MTLADDTYDIRADSNDKIQCVRHICICGMINEDKLHLGGSSK